MSAPVFGGISRVEHRIEAPAVILIRVRQDEDVNVRDLAVELFSKLQQVGMYVVAARVVFVAGLDRSVAINDDLGLVAQRDQRTIAVSNRKVCNAGVHCSFSNVAGKNQKLMVETWSSAAATASLAPRVFSLPIDAI